MLDFRTRPVRHHNIGVHYGILNGHAKESTPGKNCCLIFPNLKLTVRSLGESIGVTRSMDIDLKRYPPMHQSDRDLAKKRAFDDSYHSGESINGVFREQM